MARGQIDGIVCTIESELGKEYCHTCRTWVEPPPIQRIDQFGGAHTDTNFRCPICNRLLWERVARLKSLG